MATVLITLPYIGYDSFDDGDYSRLEQVRVYPYSTPEEVRATQEAILRQDLEAGNGNYDHFIYDVPPAPTPPLLTLEEAQDPSFVAEAAARHEAALARHREEHALVEEVAAYLEAEDFTVIPEHLRELLWKAYCTPEPGYAPRHLLRDL